MDRPEWFPSFLWPRSKRQPRTPPTLQDEGMEDLRRQAAEVLETYEERQRLVDATTLELNDLVMSRTTPIAQPPNGD